MESSTATAPVWVRAIPFVIVIALLVFRMIRPQRISVARMWLTPVILCVLAAFVIYETERLNPAPVWEIAIGLAVGLVAGIPLGILRGHHTDVRPTDRPGVMYLGASWATALIFLGAFGLRFGVRAIMPQRGALAAAVGDALLAFAMAFIVTSYVAIYRKYEAEVARR